MTKRTDSRCSKRVRSSVKSHSLILSCALDKASFQVISIAEFDRLSQAEKPVDLQVKINLAYEMAPTDHQRNHGSNLTRELGHGRDPCGDRAIHGTRTDRNVPVHVRARCEQSASGIHAGYDDDIHPNSYRICDCFIRQHQDQSLSGQRLWF